MIVFAIVMQSDPLAAAGIARATGSETPPSGSLSRRAAVQDGAQPDNAREILRVPAGAVAGGELGRGGDDALERGRDPGRWIVPTWLGISSSSPAAGRIGAVAATACL